MGRFPLKKVEEEEKNILLNVILISAFTYTESEHLFLP